MRTMVNDASNFTTATRTARRRWLLAALLFVLFRALPNLSYPIGRDQATYFVIGEGLLHGQRLYRDFPENKPPGILAFYALLGKLFGHVMWSVGLVDILWLLSISYCIFRFAERHLGAPAAAIAVGRQRRLALPIRLHGRRPDGMFPDAAGVCRLLGGCR